MKFKARELYAKYDEVPVSPSENPDPRTFAPLEQGEPQAPCADMPSRTWYADASLGM